MGKKIREYRNRTDRILDEEQMSREEWEALLLYHLQQIAFFQHERLVHLIVTMTAAILAVLTTGFAMITGSLPATAAALLLIALFIPYILHYRLLENEVQKMYEQYDRMSEHISNSEGK